MTTNNQKKGLDKKTSIGGTEPGENSSLGVATRSQDVGGERGSKQYRKF
jgi:hypothetical protein